MRLPKKSELLSFFNFSRFSNLEHPWCTSLVIPRASSKLSKQQRTLYWQSRRLKSLNLVNIESLAHDGRLVGIVLCKDYDFLPNSNSVASTSIYALCNLSILPSVIDHCPLYYILKKLRAPRETSTTMSLSRRDTEVLSAAFQCIKGPPVKVSQVKVFSHFSSLEYHFLHSQSYSSMASVRII